MIGKAAATYKKFQMDLIGRMSVGNEDIIYEIPFFDEGFINTQIERLKRKHEMLFTEMKISQELNTEYEISKRKKLKIQIEVIETKIVHYAINSFKSLPLCRELVRGKDLKIEGLIDALECYCDNDKNQAGAKFFEYFRENKIESAYFLGNKTYGIILAESGKYEEALRHLEYAVQLRVNDTGLLIWMKKAYLAIGKQFEADRISDALYVLGVGGIEHD